MLSLISKILGKAGSAIGRAGGAARGLAAGRGAAVASAGLGVFNGAATGAMIGSAVPGVGSVTGAIVGGVTSAPARAGLGGLARRLGLSKAGGAAASSVAGGAARVAEGAAPGGVTAASNLAGALIGDVGKSTPAASKAAATTEKQIASVSRKKNRGVGRREKIARSKEAAAGAPIRTAKQATLSSNASEQALYDSAGADLPVRKGKSPAAMQSGDSLFSGQVPGATRPTQLAGGGAGNDIVDLPGRKGVGTTGTVQSGDSLFSGQVPGAARPTSVEDAAEVPGRKAASEDVAMLPGTKTSAGAPPAPGVNPAAPPPGAGPTTGAQAARTVPADSETDAAFGQATSGKSNGPEASTAPPIAKMQDPSRLIDWAVGPGIGAAIGGAEGFINYDQSKERDPLMRETPFIARMKAAGEGAAKGAGYGLAAVAGERAMVGIGKSLMSEEQRMLMPGPISLTEAFTKGFKSTAGAAGTDSMGGIANRVSNTFDETSGYVAAWRTDRGMKAEAAISARIGQVEADASEAAVRQAASGTATATPPATAPATAGAPTGRRYTVNAPPADFRAGSMAASAPAQGVGSAAPAAGSTPATAAAASATAATPTSTAPPPAFMPSSVSNRATAAPAAAAPAAPAAAATPAAAAGPSPTVTAATQASNRNAPAAAARAQVEELNKQRAKIRDNTVSSMMQLPDHMTPERISSIVSSSRGLVDAGVIGATALGAAAGTPILMAKQALHNYKEHILKPNEKTSQVSAGFSRVHNPWLSEGEATGDYGIRSTLGAQIGDGPVASKIAAAGVVAAVGGAASFGAMSATSYGGGPGHPMNALRMRDPAVSAQAQMDADASNKIRMSDPSQLGLADAEEMYYTNPSMRPVQSRSRPGMYNDTGNLTLALSALRRG